MVDRPPEIAELAVDLHERLIQMPMPLDEAAHVRGASLADLGGEHRAKPIPPEPDGLVADVDPALGQEIFDVAQRQWVSHVHHHHQTDDLRRAVEISERVAHSSSLAWPEGPRAFGLTSPVGVILTPPKRTTNGDRTVLHGGRAPKHASRGHRRSSPESSDRQLRTKKCQS